MPRSRGSEMSQTRVSPRAPLHLKSTACSEANSVHRHTADRSSPADDRRSPRSPLNDQRNKASSRVADLETKLCLAQEELKKLKEELTAAEEAKRDAQTQLEQTKKLFPAVSPPTTAAAQDLEDVKEKTMNIDEEQLPVFEAGVDLLPGEEEHSVNFPTTDVFEVAPISGEMADLSSFLAEKDNQLEIVLVENRVLRKEAEDADCRSTAAAENAEQTLTKLAGAEEELRHSKMTAERLREKLDSAETAKASLESEMKRLRVQTEQWRKAAEAAAAVLAADGAAINDSNLNGRKLGESCRSMEKNGRGFEAATGGGGWSPVIAGGGKGDTKRRGPGGRIQVLGELWKKKKGHVK